GRAGDAAAITSDLFGRGPFMRLALGLTSDTRELVVRTALANGLEVAPPWLKDDRLGTWLAAIVDARDCSSPRREGTNWIEILEEAHRKAEAARATRARLERL